MRATSSWSSVARTRRRSGSISSAIGTGRLVRSSRSSATAPSSLCAGVDHVELEEAVRQIGGLAHVVDGVADGPGRRHRDELGLHAPAGGVLRIVQDALERDALGRRQLLQDLGLLLLRQVFENVGGVVGIELAHALGDGLGRQLLEDFLADRVVDLGQRGEVELAAHQLDEARAQFRIERLDQVAGVGLVQFAGQRPRAPPASLASRSPRARDRGIRRGSRRPRRGTARRRRCGHVLLVEHAGLAVAGGTDCKIARLYAAPPALAIAETRPGSPARRS